MRYYEQMRKKILVVTAKFPFGSRGADQQDRADGIRHLIRYGYEVRVVVKTPTNHDSELTEQFSKELGIPLIPIPYKYVPRLLNLQKAREIVKRILNPFYWDGASYEYFEPEIQSKVKKEIKEWKPDLVWFDHTYLWPLYKHAKRKGIPIISRSINFEPSHFLQEDGKTIFNLILYLPKLLSEWLVIKKSDTFFSITPKEEKTYKKLGGKNVINLPLRGLPKCIKEKHEMREGKLHVFFMGSAYTVHHNKEALEFFVKEIAPEVERRAPREFIFHVLGAKLPKDMEQFIDDNTVVYDGLVDPEVALPSLDIAVTPSLFGAGMQQKIFEPACRGIPSVVSSRGIAEYPFLDGEHMIFAENKDGFVDGIIRLRDKALREKLSRNSIALCKRIFSQEVIDTIIKKELERLLHA